jgi:SAM-dependent methyltransferase
VRARRQIEARIYQDAIGQQAAEKWKMIVPFLTEHGFARRVVRKRLGLPTPLNTTDRIVLEQVIFPEYSKDPSIQTLLFVGCRSYTVHYRERFFPRQSFWTIEPDPAAAVHGAPQHVVAPLEELSRHFPEGHFDLIVCNGVFGWGLDGREQCEAAFSQCHARLKSGGHFLLGWDDIAQRSPLDLNTLSSLKRFQEYSFPPLGTSRYLTDTLYRHTYAFYKK